MEAPTGQRFCVVRAQSAGFRAAGEHVALKLSAFVLQTWRAHMMLHSHDILT